MTFLAHLGCFTSPVGYGRRSGCLGAKVPLKSQVVPSLYLMLVGIIADKSLDLVRYIGKKGHSPRLDLIIFAKVI